MFLILCPWCGHRPEGEFTYGGDATAAMPELGGGAEAPEWFDYLYLRDNLRGPRRELWHHTAGCERWFRLHRDTATHEILESTPPQGDQEVGR